MPVGMAMNAIWLDGWDVHGHVDRHGERQVSASFTAPMESCPKCGVVGRLYRHGGKTIEYRDIPAFGKKVVIVADVGRYRCRECGATSMQELPDMDTRRRMTKRLVRHIREQGIAQTFSAIAREIGVDEKTVRNICEDGLDDMMAQHVIDAPIILGIDELTLGGKKRTVFVDVAGKKLLDIIDAMHRSRVDRWLHHLPNKDRVRIVTLDMWGPYAEAVSVLPNAIIVVDKWHVQSKANGYLDAVRNRFRRSAKGKDRKNPHRGRLLLHTRYSRLSVQRQFVLDGVLKNNPLISDAWHCKERFYDIWGATDRGAAEAAFDAWAAAIPETVPEFKNLAATVEDHRSYIFNYFDHPFTNAYTEARNRLIKDLSRAGRGYNFEKIRAKALLSPRLTGEPLHLCESCLGQFPTIIELHKVVGPNGKIIRSMRVCPNCHRRFHMEGGALHEVSSTPKSG